MAADIDLGRAQETAMEAEGLGADALAVRCNVGEVASIEEMYRLTLERFGSVDILVNNAGISKNVAIEELDETEWDNMLDINLKGVFFCSKYAFIQMRKQNSGTIINMSSIAGERGGIYAGANYSASKGGVIALTKAFALNGAKYNIRVNAVAPGTVDTEITRRLGHTTADIPLGRKASTADIANSVVFLASDKANYITGMVLDINGGQLMR